MVMPRITGHWRHYATLRANGHTATVTRHEPTATYQGGTLYAVALNGSLRRSLPSWREAMAYAANVLTVQTPNSQES